MPKVLMHFGRRLPIFTVLTVIALTCATKSQARTWQIETRDNVLELQQAGGEVFISRLGPRGDGNNIRLKSPVIVAKVAGTTIGASDLEVVRVERTTPQEGVESLAVTLKHAAEPLEFVVIYSAWSDTGTFTCDVTLKNNGAQVITVDQCPSFFLRVPERSAELRYMNAEGGAKLGVERQLRTARLDDQPFHLDNARCGRSTNNTSTWLSLYRPEANLSYTMQLAYSGNWSTALLPAENGARDISVGMVFDNDGPLGLEAGRSFTLPRVALTVSPGKELDAAVHALHRFQRQYVIPKQPQNDPLLVQYNTWYGLWRAIDAQNIAEHIPLAARVGCEVFVVDATWHCCPGQNYSTNWEATLGDWEINPEKFPDGLAPIIKSVHDHGMKFGLWFEPECASLDSNLFKDHPDWFLTHRGKPIVKKTRVHLDYAKPEVRAWMTGVIDRLMKQGTIDWVKLDYNVDIGGDFDAPGDVETNTRLHDHLQGYYKWLEELAAKYPDLIIENCASGGRRADLGILGRTHTGWISDTVNPRYSVQCAWGALVEMPPEICNHWMVGDMPANKDRGSKLTITSKDPRWWDFMFRIPMNGQFGISSRMDRWPEGAMQRAAENVALYKRIRTVIRGSDVYHLTKAPQAGFYPKDWMAIQYVRPDQGKSVVMVFRLGESEPTKTFQLRGLEPDATYIIHRDGEPSGPISGSTLMQEGIAVALENEWYSQVIELSVER